MTNSLTFDLTGIEPEEGAPAADQIIAGDPRFTTWNIEDRDGSLFSGVWQATPGKWKVSYDEWEYFHIHEGHSILTEEGCEPIHLRAGDRLIVRPGLKGTWEVIETTLKDYVIKL
ncbi:cupin domain-containing protein [Rhizobium daejeonense]|uniref:Cupin domain-containing protein n=1 Tax=Rhizobium daejeonense TaxID=240521 RepID=A0A6M1SCJ2_9HYPH|nr:cupin domain-containing protein [Rhizobium daejeonense]NGO64486.1 cupin domain-containing protein [Rhizobium daejeonense]